VVLADAAYGDETAWREQLAGHALSYAVGVRPGTTVWWGEHQPLPAPKPRRRAGRPRQRLRRDTTHQPISVAEVARALPARQWRSVTWRQGVGEALSSRFARVQVRAAHHDQPRDEEWLIIEWPHGAEQPAHYGFSNLPKNTPWQPLIDTVMGRWRIEREYEELKQELGLGHYEGRNWRGFHHHASLCIAAYGFLMLERLAGRKKKPARFKAPALPPGFRPRGAGTHAPS
jgi:SRSO17 transposase